MPGPELVHSCQASKKQLSGVHRYREAGELQLVAKRVGMRWNGAAGADGQPGTRGVCALSHKQWLGAQVCRGGCLWKHKGTGRVAPGSGILAALEVEPSVGRRLGVWCVSREPWEGDHHSRRAFEVAAA